MKVISIHEPTGYLYVCDENTSKYGFINAFGNVVVPFEMDYAENVWDPWDKGGFLVFYKGDKVGFLFNAGLDGVVYEEPYYDDWCYYDGVLSAKCENRFYNWYPSEQIYYPIDVPVQRTANYKMYRDNLIKMCEESQECKLKYDDLVLNEALNGYTVVERDGMFNFLDEKGQELSDKWFDKVTNFDVYGKAKVIYKGKELQLFRLKDIRTGFYKMFVEDLNLAGAWVLLKEIDKLL